MALTENERKIIEKYTDEIFIPALTIAFNEYLNSKRFINDFSSEIAIDCDSSIPGAHDLVMKDVCEGDQYFYDLIEKKLKGIKITELKIEKTIDSK